MVSRGGLRFFGVGEDQKKREQEVHYAWRIGEIGVLKRRRKMESKQSQMNAYRRR